MHNCSICLNPSKCDCTCMDARFNHNLITMVPIKSVIPHTDNVPKYFIRKMMDVLRTQGQIEPLQVHYYSPDTFITYQNDTHGAEIVLAARALDWPDLLVLINNRYVD